MEQYLEHSNILNALRANLEGAGHVEMWYKCLCSGKDDPVQMRLNIQLANEKFLLVGD
jgi:hypothetical protein